MSDVESSTPEQTTEAPQGTNWSLLAAKHYGDDFKGDVAEEPAQEEIQEEAETEETQELAETEDIEAQETEAEETPETETEESESEEEGEELDLSDASLKDVIEAEGYDWEEFQKLQVETKVNGETRKRTIADLIATNQTLESATDRLEKAKETAKSQHQALAQKEEQLEQNFQVSTAILSKQAKLFDEREKALLNDPLREQDPAEWSARRQELADQKQEFQKEVAQLVQSYHLTKQKKAQETEAQMAKRLEDEQKELFEKLPDWKDEKKRAEGQEKLNTYLQGQELTPDSINAVSFDHKLLVMAEKARKFDEIQTKTEPAKKRLRKIPKGLKPGAKPAPVNRNQTEIAKLESQLAKNPNSRDALRIATKLSQLKRRGK